jgi:peptidoglycan/LPS O-acetylase OafA/YrhL
VGDKGLVSGRASYDYLPALDGFRAISISLVVLSHAGLGKIVPGGLGVLIFFVISGFLITRQMIVEIEREGRLTLRAFYLRRFFRLAPAMLVYVGMFSAILVWLGATITATHILSGLLYFANYYYIFVGYPPHNPIGILWSLSVEEHFYIIFPFCMMAYRDAPRKIIPVLCATVVAVLAWRIILHGICSDDPSRGICGLPGRHRTFGTDLIFDCILYGCIAALALQYYHALMHRWLINPVAFAAALAVILGTLAYRDPIFRDTWRFSLQSFSVAIVIINVLFGPWYGKIRDCLSSRPFTWLGKLSYSLYLFHYGVFVVINDLWHTESLQGVPAYAVYYLGSLALATASYYLVEKPMIRLRKRVGAHGLAAATA